MPPRFHRLYEPCVPRSRPLGAVPRIFSLKLERIAYGSAVQTFVDAVLLDGERAQSIPFVRIVGGNPIFHRRHEPLGAVVLEGLGKALASWAAGKPAGESLAFDVLTRDAALEALLADEAPGAPVVPGLAVYQRVFDVVDRYAHLAGRIGGRDVLDLWPGSGLGASGVAHFARSYAAWARASHEAAARFALHALESSEPRRTFDVVAALDVPPGDLAAIVDLARGKIARDGRILLSSRGAAGAEALRGLGSSVRPLTRLGAEALGPLDESMTWLEPLPRVYAAPPLAASPVSTARSPLKILFVLRSSARRAFGGDVVQVQRTAESLRARGHRVEVTMEPGPAAEGFDIVHLSNLTSPDETLQQARGVARFQGPVVLMPIFTDHSDETAWGMAATQAVFLSADDEAGLSARLDDVAARRVSVNGMNPPPARNDVMPQYTAMQIEIMRHVDFLVANAYSEVHRIYRYLAPGIPFAIAPSCVDASTYGAHARERFVDTYGLRDFVLVTGRIEPRKNQLMVMHAMRDEPLKLVCVGSNAEGLYGVLVRMHRQEKVIILGHMTEAELAGAYAAARVVALPSWDEVVSLSALNAAVSGPSLVLSRNSYEHEYFRDDAEYCDPGNAADIARAIRRAWETHDVRAERRAALVERVKCEYAWERAAEATEAAYYRVLAHNPRGRERLRCFA